MSEPETIERYLEELEDLLALKVTLARRERILAEVGAHLEEARKAQEAEGRDQSEAGRHAITVVGAPQTVAAAVASDPPSGASRAAIALADLWYRDSKYLRRQPVESIVLAVIVGIAFGQQWAIYGLLGAAGAFAHRARHVLLLPQPGYGRRWLKLERAARTRIRRALWKRQPLCCPQEAAFAAELRRRVSALGWGYHATFALLGSAGSLVEGIAGGGLRLVALAVALGLLGMFLLLGGARRARRKVDAELAVLDVIDDAAGEALRTGGARLRDQPEHDKASYSHALNCELTPADPNACPIRLKLEPRLLSLSTNGHQHRLRTGGDHLRELRLCLEAVAAGRYWEEWREVQAPWRLSSRPRRCMTVTSVFDTEDGRRELTNGFYWSSEDWAWWDEEQERQRASAKPVALRRTFAPTRCDEYVGAQSSAGPRGGAN